MRRAQQWLGFEQTVIRRMLQAQYFTDLTLRIEPLCAQWKRHSKPLAPAVWRWEGYRPRGTKGARWAMGLRAFKSCLCSSARIGGFSVYAVSWRTRIFLALFLRNHRRGTTVMANAVRYGMHIARETSKYEEGPPQELRDHEGKA